MSGVNAVGGASVRHSKYFIAIILLASMAVAQNARASAQPELSVPTTLPIIFTKTISADRAHVGDRISARTSQIVHLATEAIPFAYDKTPYARQKQAVLAFHFDTVSFGGRTLPLNVSVRAMADPLASWGAREPKSSDLDPDGTVTQVGGDQMTPSRTEVVNPNGDVVAYNKRGGVYAHLIASGRCDSSNVEVSVDIYSASACGLYGFTNVSASGLGTAAAPSTVTLVSSRTSPKVWKHSTALLEVVPNGQSSLAAR
jgi:hypothetical protein